MNGLHRFLHKDPYARRRRIPRTNVLRARHYRVFCERAPRRHRPCMITGNSRQQLRCKRRVPHSPKETSMKEG